MGTPVRSQADARDELVELGRALYDRGLTHGRTGNLSTQLGNQIVISPTGSCLGRLDPAQLAIVDSSGTHVGGPPPSKEVALHVALYQHHPTADAVAHTHSTHAVAWSCLDGLDDTDALPALTPYYAMRVGELPLVPYLPPGDPSIANAIHTLTSPSVLLAHHGPIAAAPTLEAAVDAVEEIEHTARIALLLRGHNHHLLSAEQVSFLR